jgi:hypothetical protein
LLRWHEHMEVLAPASLRAEIAAVTAKMSARHAQPVQEESRVVSRR